MLQISSHFKQLTLIVFIQITLSASAQAFNNKQLGGNTQESNFNDPVVWDAQSLYQSAISRHDNSPLTRYKRSPTGQSNGAQQHSQQQLVDACQSKMEILTPYYATNSKGKLRVVVNSQLMQQAIQVETCTRLPTSPSKCNAQPDCGCEQKYKWHRLLVSDPSDSGMAKGLFMDWFLFPSSCNCRCKSSAGSAKQFLRTTLRRTSGSKDQ